MNFLARESFTSIRVLFVILLVAQGVFSQEQKVSGEQGTLTLKFHYKGEAIARGEFKDRTTFDQTATLICPVVAGDVTTVSSILGPTEQQNAAHVQLGDAAKNQIEAISHKTVSSMKSMEKQMKDCKSSGMSEQLCGMQIMIAMQGNPELLADIGAMGSTGRSGLADAEKAVAVAAGNYQPWFNEGCSGSMTVNNTSQLDDPTIPGPEPILRTTGTKTFDTNDTFVTVETDLNRKETRYMIIPPQESFQRDAEYGEKPKQVTLAAIPANPVLAGPYPGPLQSGRYENKVNGGVYSVEWTFAR